VYIFISCFAVDVLLKEPRLEDLLLTTATVAGNFDYDYENVNTSKAVLFNRHCKYDIFEYERITHKWQNLTHIKSSALNWCREIG